MQLGVSSHRDSKRHNDPVNFFFNFAFGMFSSTKNGVLKIVNSKSQGNKKVFRNLTKLMRKFHKSTHQSSGSQSRNPLANGLLAIFSCVI